MDVIKSEDATCDLYDRKILHDSLRKIECEARKRDATRGSASIEALPQKFG